MKHREWTMWDDALHVCWKEAGSREEVVFYIDWLDSMCLDESED